MSCAFFCSWHERFCEVANNFKNLKRFKFLIITNPRAIVKKPPPKIPRLKIPSGEHPKGANFFMISARLRIVQKSCREKIWRPRLGISPCYRERKKAGGTIPLPGKRSPCLEAPAASCTAYKRASLRNPVVFKLVLNRGGINVYIYNI
jgi:hypothetical protein